MLGHRAKPLLIAGGLFFATLTLYFVTLAPSVATIFDDSLEFQLVTYQLGIAHPTGYPLYTLLGKLFTLIPLGTVAYRVNLMSAVFGAATVALLFLLILQSTPPTSKVQQDFQPSVWPAYLGGAVGALLLAISPVFWQQATIAEVYTLNAFFVVLLLLLATRLPALNVRTGVLWLAFLAGFSLTHHRTMLLLLPALALYTLLVYGRKLFNSKLLLLSLLLFLLPLLLYLYLPLRGHVGSLDGTYKNNWAGFWRQVTASGYGTFIFDNPFGQARNFAFYWNLLADQFYTSVLGLIGLIYLLFIGQRRILLLTGVTFLTYLIFNLFYNVSDIEVFLIPNFLIWAVWSGVGASFLLYSAAGIRLKTADRRPLTAAASKEGGSSGRTASGDENVGQVANLSPQKESKETAFPMVKPRWQPFLVGGIVAIFGLVLGQLFLTGWTTVSQKYTWQVHNYGLDMLQQPTPNEEAAIAGILGEMSLLRYFQQTENRRPDIETVTADKEADRLAAVENLLAAGKSVYLTRELPGAAQRWSLSAAGPLIRVNPQPVTTPPDFSFSVNQSVTPEITLLGYNLTQVPHTGPGPAPLRLTLFWQVDTPPAAELKVSARLLNQAGAVVAATDGEPVHFAYPTRAWRPDEIIADVYDLMLVVDTPPGQYTPLIIWYDPAQNAAEVGRIELEPISIQLILNHNWPTIPVSKFETTN